RHTVSLDGKTHVPVVHVPLDRNGLDLTLHRPVQFDLDETSALDTQLPVFEPSAAIAVGRKGDTVVPPERTEAREAGLLAASYANEERLEGLIQPAEHILAAGEVGQSEQPFFPHRLQLLGLVVVGPCSCGKLSKRRAVPEARRCRGRKPRGAGSRGTEPGLRWSRDGICRPSAQTRVCKEHRSTANKKRRHTHMQKKAAFPCHLKETVPCGRIYGESSDAWRACCSILTRWYGGLRRAKSSPGVRGQSWKMPELLFTFRRFALGSWRLKPTSASSSLGCWSTASRVRSKKRVFWSSRLSSSMRSARALSAGSTKIPLTVCWWPRRKSRISRSSAATKCSMNMTFAAFAAFGERG